ncbi:MAG: hypothetical protein RR336_08095, partial [Oscillospiraceae bacterium]
MKYRSLGLTNGGSFGILTELTHDASTTAATSASPQNFEKKWLTNETSCVRIVNVPQTGTVPCKLNNVTKKKAPKGKCFVRNHRVPEVASKVGICQLS